MLEAPRAYTLPCPGPSVPRGGVLHLRSIDRVGLRAQAYLLHIGVYGSGLCKRRRISLMTVFLPRENLFFIEEWLKYHIVLGFTHFYLYNNSGSRFIDCGNNIELNAKNKRGESIYPLLAHYTDAEVQDALENILAPFVAQGYVTQVMWQPRDEHGNITYAQSLAFLDYVAKYARETDWVSFTDLDEFIVPLQHEDVQGLVRCTRAGGIHLRHLTPKTLRVAI